MDSVARCRACIRQHGIAGLCPTLVTNSLKPGPRLHHPPAGLRAGPGPGRAFPGFTWRGPTSAPRTGTRAHPRQHVRPPRSEEFCRLQEAARRAYSPGNSGPRAGRRPAIHRKAGRRRGGSCPGPHGRLRALHPRGHSGRCGLSTHLGNGCMPCCPAMTMSSGSNSPPMACGPASSATATISTHGARCILRIKTPAACTDLRRQQFGGLTTGPVRPVGPDTGNCPRGQVVVPGTAYLAGSGQFLDACVRHVVTLGEATLADALDVGEALPVARLAHRRSRGRQPGRSRTVRPGGRECVRGAADGCWRRLTWQLWNRREKAGPSPVILSGERPG